MMSILTVDPVTEYAELVISGKLTASDKNVKAAKRHMKDLKSDKFNYDPARGNRVIKFIEMLPDIKTGKPNKLLLFQKFIIGSLYNWHTKDGYKRFNRAYISMSRKNGKSILVAGINLYELLWGTNPAYSRQIYCTANAKEQAAIVWNMIRKQLESTQQKSKRIKSITKITESRNLIQNTQDGSLIRPLSKDTTSLDGFEPYIGILDEYHEAKDNSMEEVLRSGMILLKEKLIAIISTAGFHLNGPMYKEYQYVGKLLNQEVENDGYFAFVAEQDSVKEIDDESQWIKSNPLLESEELSETIFKNIREDWQELVDKGETHKIITKNFNIWQSASEESYLSERDWLKSVDTSAVPSEEVYIGVDLSRLHDLSAVGFVHPIEDRFLIDAYGFVATRGGIAEKINKDKIDYLELERQNQLELTKSKTGIIDYEQIVDFILQKIIRDNLEVKALCYDPWGATQFLTIIEKKMQQHSLSFPLIEVSQTYKEIGPAVKQLRLDLMADKITHTNNELLNIGVRNAMVRKDNNGNLILDKKKNREKIDSIVAVVNAYTEAMMHEFQVNYDDVVMNDQFGF